MITSSDIRTYFNLEAEQAKKKWDDLMDLPIEERIRKRKAIENVYIDKSYGWADSKIDSNSQIKINFTTNLSDFKEGEALLLHNDEFNLKCNLVSVNDDNSIILDFFVPDYPIKPYNFDNEKPLILDKNFIDLRQNVYNKFLLNLESDPNFWKSHIVNYPHKPKFSNKVLCRKCLEETCESFKIDLLNSQKEAILRALESKDYYLIQGPPGTGKSFVLALIILMEMFDFDHKVIVIGPNHLAINNTLEQFLSIYPQAFYHVYKVGQYYNAPQKEILYEKNKRKMTNINQINVENTLSTDFPWVIGLTPHSLYTSRAAGLKCDTLIIDEAGQMTIPLALMGMIKAKKIILAGDHKQLPPIVPSDIQKEEMKSSVFQLLMREYNCTMLDVSFRMCEPICKFVSELFYDGLLQSHKTGCGNMIKDEDPLFDFQTPVVFHDIPDEGEQISNGEAEYISDVVQGFLERGLPANEIAVLSPFRAQATNVKRHIRNNPSINDDQKNLITSDTVDRMQGQEREVIIYSFTAGNLDYINEMAEFLYSPNKLNVAFSRAKSKLIIVANISHLKEISEEDYPHIQNMLNSNYVTFV